LISSCHPKIFPCALSMVSLPFSSPLFERLLCDTGWDWVEVPICQRCTNLEGQTQCPVSSYIYLWNAESTIEQPKCSRITIVAFDLCLWFVSKNLWSISKRGVGKRKQRWICQEICLPWTYAIILCFMVHYKNGMLI
jgi:hypothetical protein